MQFQTFGGANSQPRVGPLVISEVAYHPEQPSAAALLVDPTLIDDDLEFIEIHNPTGSTVDLTDWRLAGDPDFDFAPGTMLGSGETLVVLAFDPAADPTRANAFRTHYGIGGGVALVGGYVGHLNNSYALIRLERPESPTILGFSEDEVLLDDLPPWPTAADGLGSSLQRNSTTSYGNSASSWIASAPNPGSATFTNYSADFDNDGFVTGLDFLAWQRGAGTQSPNATKADGDADDDMDVDSFDLDIWESQYGTSVLVAASSAAEEEESASALAVPSEPAPAIAASVAPEPAAALETASVESKSPSTSSPSESFGANTWLALSSTSSAATSEILVEEEPSFNSLPAEQIDSAFESAAEPSSLSDSAEPLSIQEALDSDDDSEVVDEAFDDWNALVGAF
jgi:hypothetical protein